MKKFLQKGIRVFLSASLTAGLLAGCGGGGGEQSSSSAAEGGDSVPTFTIATMRWSDAWPTDFLESGIMKELEEEHGINIEWEIYYASDWSEQKSLLLASGDLPDAFLGSNALTASDMAQNKGNFVELTDLITEETMPNLTALFEEDPELKAVCTDRDGKIYSLPKKLGIRPEVDGYVFYINKEWLDNLGLEVPSTYEELENVLEAFITEDADGDGDPGNEIGYTNSAASNLLSGDLRNILRPFGTMVSRADNYMGINGDGEAVFVPMEENYKEAVKWMHDMWTKGILDPEYFTQDASMVTSKIQAEGGSQVGLITGWTADAVAGTNMDQFVLLEALEGPDGNRYVENASNYLDIADRELVITKECEDPEKLLEWADDFYDDLVTLQTQYGSISDGCITDNGDGTYTINEPEDGTSVDTSAWSNSLRDFGPKYMHEDFYDKVILPEGQGDGIKMKEDEVNAKYVTDDVNVGYPMVQYTDEELNTLTMTGTDIYQYVEAQYAHWVVDGGIDEEWDSYLSQLDAMGIQEILKIQKDAYAAYQTTMSES